MKKIVIVISFICLIMIFGGQTVFAGENMQLMGVIDDNNPISLYVKGVNEEVTSLSVMAGNVQCEDLEICKNVDQDVSIRTYILIDNSLSIPENIRTQEKQWIENLIISGNENEEYALATFGNIIEEYVGFTKDDKKIRASLEKIEPVKRTTYLTDVLYELLQSDAITTAKNNAYTRIVVISDGVDKKTLGITREELISVINEVHVPIYTLGVYDKTKSNKDELKKMFSIARQTNGQALLIEDEASWNEAKEILESDNEILKINVNLPNDMLDGSLRTIKLEIETSTSSYNMSVDNVRMAQNVMEIETQIQESNSEEILNVDEEPKQIGKIVIIITIVTLFIFAVGVLGFLLYKKKSSIKEDENIDWREEDEIFKNQVAENNPSENNRHENYYNETIMLQPDDYEETICMFDSGVPELVQLIDEDTAEAIFSGRLVEGQQITIGRRKEENNVSITNDMAISGKHCIICRSNRNYYIRDMHSQNGTFVNGKRIVELSELKKGDVIKIGHTELYFEIS